MREQAKINTGNKRSVSRGMKIRIAGSFLLVSLIITLSGWGWVGHRIIGMNASLSYTPEMDKLLELLPYIEDHSSDADYRKGDDPAEGPKHYIDIDNYPEFIADGRIPQTLDSCITLYGSGFVDNNGYLPWATLDSYNKLVQSFVEENWETAKIHAADLSHYVADGFMPMHITRNYNGQFTNNNYGIHSRYESSMVGEYKDEIEYEGEPARKVEGVANYIFSYLYENYKYVDSVLLADDFAQSIAGSTSGGLYYSTMWEKTNRFTHELFHGASHTLASLIYTAWEESKTDTSSVVDVKANIMEEMEAYPNPFREVIHISFTLLRPGHITMQLYDSQGRKIVENEFSGLEAGRHDLSLPVKNLVPGSCFLVVRSVNSVVVRKLLVE